MATEEQIKQQLYDRQRHVIGGDTQRKYGETDVLIVGLSGLGCEIAKNVILSGVHSVTLVDSSPVLWADLSSMFYATPADVGKPRAATLLPRLSELNRFVSTKVHDGAINEALIAAHHVVCFVDHLTTQLITESNWARAHNVKFVACESRGVAGAIFVDAGESFTVNDTNGEETVCCICTAITSEGDVMCHDDKKHECVEGDYVYFTRVPELPQLNTVDTTKPRLFKVSSIEGPFALRIAAVEGSLPKERDQKLSGYMHTTKQPVVLHFKPLAEAIKDPSFVMLDDDEVKLTAPSELHALFQAIHNAAVQHNHGKVPDVAQEGLLQQAVDAAVAHLGATTEKEKEQLVARLRPLASVFCGNLNPMACLIGGLASQEILKVSSGKFTPTLQWLYYDAREVLHALGGVPSAAQRAPRKCRYDGQIAVFGAEMQEKILSQSGFIVGAGALGCELVKNYACIGYGCSPASSIHITDMDTIELSNLSRQFLFRTRHIGKAKSLCAAEAAREINASLNIIALEQKVGTDTEHIFTEEFWTSKNVICNALDNVQARRYVDGQCVFYKRPLFESGTLGTKCNTQCVIPFLTESYSSSYDPPEKTIPLCTLKNFPNSIEHTIQWAREMFEKFFTNSANDINGYLHDPNFMTNLNNDPGNKPAVFAHLIDGINNRPKTYSDCIVWARCKFEELFCINIKQLLHNLPLDKVDEYGQSFWSGAKKPPAPLTFDVTNPVHYGYVVSAANLFAFMYCIPVGGLSDEEVRRLAMTTRVPEFQPAVVKFALKENEQQQKDEVAVLNASVDESRLPPREGNSALRLHAIEFEKDDDTNFHMDYITAVSNLRATSYSIPVEDKVRTKMIAGKIIPAMVTTTALVTGLVGFETLKYVFGTKDVNLYKCAFVNIALPFLSFASPIQPKVVIHKLTNGRENQYTMWDRFDIDEGRDVTLKELVHIMKHRFHIEPSMMSTVDGKLIYSSFGMKAERMTMPVSRVVEEVAKSTIDPKIKHISFVVTPDEEVDIPLLRYKFRTA